jgi:hypothetical protein
MVWGTVETEGADGWRGTYRGWVDEADGSHTVGALEGFGAYAGLTLANRGLGDLPGSRSTGEDEGIIYTGTPPPWDETLSE